MSGRIPLYPCCVFQVPPLKGKREELENEDAPGWAKTLRAVGRVH